MVQHAVHLGLQLAGVYIGELEKFVVFAPEAVVGGADPVIISQNLLDLDAGENGQKFILGGKIGGVERVVAFGVEVVLQPLGGGDDGKVDVGPDVDEPVHRKLFHVPGVGRVGDQHHPDPALDFKVGIAVEAVKLGYIAPGDGHHLLVDQLGALLRDGMAVHAAVFQKTVVGCFALHARIPPSP